MSVALVFAGGGARGAFEVGASLFLYDTYQVRPDILCGTSVGAINAAKLAEGGTATEKRTALEELRSFWLELVGLVVPDDPRILLGLAPKVSI